ncbi:MAG: hypothetical protein ABIP41_04785 [Croceibacterium sp.]
MNVTMEISERQLRIGVIKLGVSIAVLLMFGTFLVSLLIPRTSELSFIPIEAILFSVAFSILVGGVRSFLSIIDWFENRRSKRMSSSG